MTENNLELLENLVNYYEWAELRVQKLIRDLTDDEYKHIDEKIGRSIHSLIIHIAITYDWHFYSPDFNKYVELTNKAESFSREELLNYWSSSLKKFVTEVKTCKNKFFELPTGSGEVKKFKSFDYFLGYTDHATYHRGQLLTQLRLLGKEGINTDYFTYLSEIT